MEGKRKKKRKVGKIVLLGMSFLLTIVLTSTLTLAWFYDSDWASNYVTMAGSVGIDLRDSSNTIIADADKGISGSGNLHFIITTDKAYPGQAIDVSASAYNNGGRSVNNNTSEGSPCYIRAHFAVYTDIGQDDPTTEDVNEAEIESEMNARSLYDFLFDLIEAQNAVTDTDYEWIYLSNKNAGNGQYLSASGTSEADRKYYYEGSSYTTQDLATAANTDNKGYFYLCYKSGKGTTVTDKNKQSVAITETGVLKSLPVGETAVFLWNSTFIIPWTLTNYSADKNIFVAVEFQAIQTFIPEITNGIISNAANNQLSAEKCYYNDSSVQTVFNSCSFSSMSLIIDTENGTLNFGSGSYAKISTPDTSDYAD